MKTIKPTRLSLLHRTIEHDGQAYLVVSVFLAFGFDEPRALLPEHELWKLVTDELVSEQGVLDEGNSKQCGEVLVNGRCFVPGKAPAEVSFVRVQVGAVDKRLAVIGDRQWRHGVPTKPEPFTEMPVDWAHAFGGPGYAQNPLGKGAMPVTTPAGKVHPLPNIEDPKRLVVSPGDRPAPAGLGPIDMMWPQRYSLVGTYDAKWMKTRFPGFAADLDPSFFNTATKDQRVSGYFEGSEAFVIENMHPEKPRIAGNLPGALVRVFLQGHGEGDPLRELTTRLDTIRLFPHRERAVLVFRGMAAVKEDDAADIKHLLVACEDPGFPRTVERYQAVLAGRLDKQKAALLALKDEDLMPPAEAGWSARVGKTDVGELIAGEGFFRKNQVRRRAKVLADLRERTVKAGLDPSLFKLDEPVEEAEPTDAESIDVLVAQMDTAERDAAERKEQGEKKRKELEDEARRAFAERGVDFDEAVRQAKKEAAGPPKFRAQKHLELLRQNLALARAGGAPLVEMEIQAEDPKYYQQLCLQEKQLMDVYRRGAHMNDAAESMEAERSEAARAEIEAAHHNAIGLTGRDFTGANLSGMVLKGVDLSGAFLEGVDLSGADLSNANLTGAVLAHARLVGTNFSAAKLDGVNLGGATVDGCDFSNASLTETVLSRATLARTKFASAKLRQVDFLEAKFNDGVDFSGAEIHEVVFIRVDIEGVSFSGADLTRTQFVEVRGHRVDFSGAILLKTAFITADLEGSNFRGAKLSGTRFVEQTSLVDADLSESSGERTMLRGTKLTRAKLTGAHLNQADFSECDLSDANLYRLVARDAFFIRANLSRALMASADLLGAILQKATLFGTDLRGASLFRADLARVHVDRQTKLEETNMKNARILPRATDGLG